MAHADTEIELKFSVDRETFLRLRESLRKTASSKVKEGQTDRYFTPHHRNFVEPEYPFEWFSIRRRGGKAILTYKHWHPAGAREHTHCDEFETVLGRPEQLEKILSSLDFRELVTVEKQRETFTLKEGFDISLDDVKGLGFFVELETTRDFGSVEAARERLFQLARDLGLNTTSLDKRGYPYQLMKKKGLV